MSAKAMALLFAICDHQDNHRSEASELQEAIKNTVNAMLDMEKDVQEWAALSSLRAWYFRHEIAEKIGDHEENLKTLTESLSLATMIQIHRQILDIQESLKNNPAGSADRKPAEEQPSRLRSASPGHRLEDSRGLSSASYDGSDTQEGLHTFTLQVDRDSARVDYPPDIGSNAAIPVPATPVGSGRNEIESQAQPGPGILDIPEELGGDLTILVDGPRLAGGFATVQKGIWTSPEGVKIEVAVKTLKIEQSSITQDRGDLKKTFEIRMKREIIIWSRAQHQNIHIFLGFRSQPEPQFISVWCRHGNLTDYLHNNPRLSSSEKLILIIQAGRGLAYLHSQSPPMCHADIKPENVLINDSGEAALSDFGLSRVLLGLNMHSGLTTGTSIWGTPGYMAPELFDDDNTDGPTCESDVYAFGGLILAVMSGKAPFADSSPHAIMCYVIKGKQPQAASHPSLPACDPLWGVIRRCWDTDSKKRPSMPEIVVELENNAANL